MSKVKHTPGPWAVEKDGSSLWVVAHQPAWRSQPDGVRPIPTDTRIKCGEANAHLIAAAPDLLAALKRCAGVISGSTMTKNELIEALEMSRAAIAKAEPTP